jgi:hypothetical protein
VTFWTLPIAEEFLFPNWQTCKALRQYIKYCFKTGYRLPGYKEDLEKFSMMVGQPMLRKTFIDIYDNLNCRKVDTSDVMVIRVKIKFRVMIAIQPRTQALRSDVRYERQNEEPGYEVGLQLGLKQG